MTSLPFQWWKTSVRPDLKGRLDPSAFLRPSSPPQLQRQHPPPKPPASLSTVIKVFPLPYAPPSPGPTPHTQSHTFGGDERRREERRGGEMALSWGRLGVRLADRGSRVTTLTLSLCFSLSLLPLLPNVGYPSPCLTDVCQTIQLSPLWGTGWTPSRWAAIVKTSSMPDSLPLTW